MGYWPGAFGKPGVRAVCEEKSRQEWQAEQGLMVFGTVDVCDHSMVRVRVF